MTQEPLILLTKDHKTCHNRWLQFKRDFPDRISIAKKLFEIAEASVRAFGPHMDDVWWIDQHKLYEEVYGKYDPVDLLLDAMHFPAHSDMVDRTRTIGQVKSLVREHEDYGSDGNYMPRSVILGWIARHHDLILSDLNEAA